MFFWIVQCTRHYLVTRPILDTLRPRAGAAAAAEAAPGVPAVPKPAVLQLRIVILSGATGSQDRFKLPATRAVTAAGHWKRSGNLNRQADSDSEPAVTAPARRRLGPRMCRLGPRRSRCRLSPPVPAWLPPV